MIAEPFDFGSGPGCSWRQFVPDVDLGQLAVYAIEVPKRGRYLAIATHLRPLPTSPEPAVLLFPAATHQFAVVALHDDYPAAPPWHVFAPAVVLFQVACTRDDIVANVAELCIDGIAAGRLRIPTGKIAGDSERWRHTFERTMEHLLIGHPR